MGSKRKTTLRILSFLHKPDFWRFNNDTYGIQKRIHKNLVECKHYQHPFITPFSTNIERKWHCTKLNTNRNLCKFFDAHFS